MKIRTSISTLLAVLAPAAVTSCSTDSATTVSQLHASTASATTPATQTQPADPQVVYAHKYAAIKSMRIDMSKTAGQLLQAGGLEMSSAGIHLLYTSVKDPDVTDRSFPGLFENSVRNWAFWPCDAKYMMAYQDWHKADGSSIDFIPMSYREMIPRSGLSYHRGVDSATGLYSVVATFDSRAIGFLRYIRQPKESAYGQTTDWYGIKRNSSEPYTKMRFALVSENVAYLPVSIDDLLQDVDDNNLNSYQVELANGLQMSEADDLIAKL